MNLEDLRTHLTNQADEVDPTTPVPLPTIRHHRTALKRRRTTAILTTAAAAVAVIAALLPGAFNTSAPAPAKPPPDVTRYGVTIPGAVGPDRLDKAEIAKPGTKTLDFTWTPTSTSLTFRSYCQTKTSRQVVRVTVDNYLVLNEPCDDTGGRPHHQSAVPSNHLFWLQVTPGKATKVHVFVIGESAEDSVSVTALAVGIYQSPQQPKDPAFAGLPVRTPPPDPGDYVKEGFRIPAKIASQDLLSGAIGSLGQQTLTQRFTATGGAVNIRAFCAIEMIADLFTLKISVNGRPVSPIRCAETRGDLTQVQPTDHLVATAPGKPVLVTLKVVETATGKPFENLPPVHIGVGAYTVSKHRIISGRSDIPELLEYGGYRYKLATVQTAPAADGQVTVDTPAGKPYLMTFGGAELGLAEVWVKILGLDREASVLLGEDPTVLNPNRGGRTVGQPAGRAGKVTQKVVSGRPTQGLLYLGLYLPE
ncbi:hypothetical protein [Kribbella sp. NPDC051718]|uniref:hypothetical protein n=1 Tax=Kribbella sp. NPDC051718 TaxID=3155168 RepID=UPI00341ED537